MKVVSFSLASPKAPFKVQLQFPRSFVQMVLGADPVRSVFTDHGYFWSEMPPSGIAVTCDPETANFLNLLRKELETGIKGVPKKARRAFLSPIHFGKTR